MWSLNAAAATVRVIVSLTTQTFISITGADLARSGLTLGSDGISYQEAGTDASPTQTAVDQPANWINAKLGMDQYEVMVTNAGPDALIAGNLNVWEDLGTTRLWLNQRPNASNGTTESVLTVQIRRIADPGNILANEVYTLHSERI